jgi:sugar-specific transcriptional regulator TrmB
MIVREELMSKLRRYFNLNLYEVRIWTALLSRGVSTAGELSDIGQVPRSRAYDVLETLEKKGFVVMKLGKPIKYIAVEPTEVVERVKKNIAQEAENSMTILKELNTTDVLKELDTLHKQGVEFIDSTDLSGAIRGKHNLYTHLETMVKNAEKSVTIVTTSKGLIR